MTTEEKIDALAQANQENAALLQTLLTRDPRKEFGYGPQYDPNVTRRFQSNMWRSGNPVPATTTPLVFNAPNSVEEMTLSLASNADTRGLVLIRVDMDVNDKFSNVPADGRDHSIFIVPSVANLNAFNVATGASTSFNYGWYQRFPCVAKWVRFVMVNAQGVSIVWPAPAIRVGVGFHGQ